MREVRSRALLVRFEEWRCREDARPREELAQNRGAAGAELIVWNPRVLLADRRLVRVELRRQLAEDREIRIDQHTRVWTARRGCVLRGENQSVHALAKIRADLRFI